MNNNETMKVCENGHCYQGDSCPYCPKVYDKETRLYPGAGSVNIPLCPHCGKPLRKRENIYPVGEKVGSVGNPYDGKIPWNYRWNGRCENCGHDFDISIRQNLGGFGLGDRHTSVKVRTQRCNHITAGFNGDSGLILSGVEIETYVEEHSGDRRIQRVFLSTNELKYLMKVLANSPILQQEDSEWMDRQDWRSLT